MHAIHRPRRAVAAQIESQQTQQHATQGIEEPHLGQEPEVFRHTGLSGIERHPEVDDRHEPEGEDDCARQAAKGKISHGPKANQDTGK